MSVFSIGDDGVLDSVLNQDSDDDVRFTAASDIVVVADPDNPTASIYIAANAVDNGSDTAEGAISFIAVTDASGQLALDTNTTSTATTPNNTELGTGGNVDLQNVGALLDLTASVSSASSSAPVIMSSNFHDQNLAVYLFSNGAVSQRLSEISDNTDQLGGTGPVFAIAASQVESNYYVYAVSFDNDSIASFSIDISSGELTAASGVADDDSLALEGAVAVTSGIIEGIVYVFVAGYVDGGISVFSVANDGTFANVANVSNDDNLTLDGIMALEYATIDGESYLFAAGFLGGAISVFKVDANGTLSSDSTVNDTDNTLLGGVSDIEVVSLNGRHYLYASSYGEDGVQVFAINP